MGQVEGYSKDEGARFMDELKDAILEAQVEASLGGHDLTPFDTVENGYQATFRLCGLTSWVGKAGLRYSLLEDACPGSNNSDFV